jgi:integrator complex subunit 1
MLWDPDGPSRKPPREVADLLLSVEELFELSDTFQRSISPDYLSMTIGNTTRAAVERAYDWLIPVIARAPATIARLQSSTSCFLLLRAYGTNGEERKQLKELASPLLRHVQESLKGQFGIGDSVEAFALLMSDVASQNPDRRRCARRVLHDALLTRDVTPSKPGSWMLNILQLDHAAALVSDGVKFMVRGQEYSNRLFVIASDHPFDTLTNRQAPQLSKGETFSDPS